MSDEGQGGNAPDLMGYKSVDDLVAAKRASDQEARRMAERIGRLETMMTETMAANPRQPVPNRDPYARLDELGVPADAVREAIRNEVTSAISGAFEPIVRGSQARQQVLSRYPDYNKFEADVATFIQSDPDLSQTYQRVFNADPAAAMELAILKFGQTQRGRTAPAEEPSVTENALPSMRSGDARQPADTREQVRAAWEHFQKTGNPRAFAAARLRESIPDSFLNG